MATDKKLLPGDRVRIKQGTCSFCSDTVKYYRDSRTIGVVVGKSPHPVLTVHTCFEHELYEFSPDELEFVS